MSEAEKHDLEKSDYRFDKDKSDLKKILDKVGMLLLLFVCSSL